MVIHGKRGCRRSCAGCDSERNWNIAAVVFSLPLGISSRLETESPGHENDEAIAFRHQIKSAKSSSRPF